MKLLDEVFFYFIMESGRGSEEERLKNEYANDNYHQPVRAYEFVNFQRQYTPLNNDNDRMSQGSSSMMMHANHEANYQSQMIGLTTLRNPSNLSAFSQETTINNIHFHDQNLSSQSMDLPETIDMSNVRSFESSFMRENGKIDHSQQTFVNSGNLSTSNHTIAELSNERQKVDFKVASEGHDFGNETGNELLCTAQPHSDPNNLELTAASGDEQGVGTTVSISNKQYANQNTVKKDADQSTSNAKEKTKSSLNDEKVMKIVNNNTSSYVSTRTPASFMPRACRISLACEKILLQGLGVMRFNCNVCEQSFTQMRHLQKHFSQAHEGQSDHEDEGDDKDKFLVKYLCPICGTYLSKRYGLTRHFKRVHADVKAIRCPECNFIAKTSLEYMKHTSKHSPESPSCLPKAMASSGKSQLKCHKCHLMFDNKAGLRLHVHNHKVSSSLDQILPSDGKDMTFCTCFSHSHSTDVMDSDDHKILMCNLHPNHSIRKAESGIDDILRHILPSEMESIVVDSLGIIATCTGKMDKLITSLQELKSPSSSLHFKAQGDGIYSHSFQNLMYTLNLINLVSVELTGLATTLEHILVAEIGQAKGSIDIGEGLCVGNNNVFGNTEDMCEIDAVMNETFDDIEDAEVAVEVTEVKEEIERPDKATEPSTSKISEETDVHKDNARAVNKRGRTRKKDCELREEKRNFVKEENVESSTNNARILPKRKCRGRPRKRPVSPTIAEEGNAKEVKKKSERKKGGRRASTIKYSCEECGKENMTRTKYERHVAKHSDNRPYSCELCPLKFKRPDAVKRHMIKHSTERPFKCDLCSYAAKTAKELQKHSFIHDEEKRHPCQKCSFKARTAYELSKHEKKHSPCPMCGYMATDNQDYKAHKRSHISYSCTECSYTCHFNYQLQEHSLTHKTGQESTKFFCELCGYTCRLKRQLKYHMIRHTDKTPYSCPDCSYKCSSKASLNGHKLMHKGLKPCLCSICGAAFRRGSGLNKHMLLHTGEKKWACSFCGRPFRSKSNMKAHEMIHKGERPVKCLHCDFRCRWNRELKIHIKSKHKDMTIEIPGPTQIGEILESDSSVIPVLTTPYSKPTGSIVPQFLV